MFCHFPEFTGYSGITRAGKKKKKKLIHLITKKKELGGRRAKEMETQLIWDPLDQAGSD
jgi:hypothetical protein